MDTVTTATALVVDDNYFNRDLCTLALEHVGYEVFEAKDGLEALKVLETQSFGLLVLDLAMPELDGAGVIRQIRQKEMYSSMTVVVLTANHHMATDEIDLSADYLMLKPIDVNDFAQFAQRLVNHKKKPSASA